MTKEEAITIKKALTDYKHLILSARNAMRDSLSCDNTFGSRRTLVDGLLICCANAEYMDTVDLPKVLNILKKYDDAELETSKDFKIVLDKPTKKSAKRASTKKGVSKCSISVRSVKK